MTYQPKRPETATRLHYPQELHCEVMDTTTTQVWQSLEPITRAEYEALPIDQGWIRTGIGRAAMDEHWFTRSPGQVEDGPMAVREIDGRMFGMCARPGGAPSPLEGSDGSITLPVDKHHVLVFAAGRRVPILKNPCGDLFVHVIEGGEGKASLLLPDGWKTVYASLENDWVVVLPHPTTVFFFHNGDSFQGPIALPLT